MGRIWAALGGRKTALAVVFVAVGSALALRGVLDWPAVTLLVGVYTSLAGTNAANTVAALRAGRGDTHSGWGGEGGQ